LYDEINRLGFAAPWLQVQIQNCLIVFHAEKAKLALGTSQQELNLIIDEAMDTIKPQYLSHVLYVSKKWPYNLSSMYRI
jgi:hypothetical protein